MFDGDRVLVWEDEKALEMGGRPLLPPPIQAHSYPLSGFFLIKHITTSNQVLICLYGVDLPKQAVKSMKIGVFPHTVPGT